MPKLQHTIVILYHWSTCSCVSTSSCKHMFSIPSPSKEIVNHNKHKSLTSFLRQSRSVRRFIRRKHHHRLLPRQHTTPPSPPPLRLRIHKLAVVVEYDLSENHLHDRSSIVSSRATSTLALCFFSPCLLWLLTRPFAQCPKHGTSYPRPST